MYLISLILFIIGIFIILLLMVLNFNNNIPNRIKNKIKRICILVPARYESDVIEDLLKSIKKQTYKLDMKDVYVIIESEKDKTNDICKKYSASVFVRKNLRLQRKGYALDEAVKYILDKDIHYDAYFIFDADNVLDKNFIKNMIPIIDKGYDIACGYRNCKNGNDSVVAASSSLTFSLINTLFNNIKCSKTRNITFSGTGYYIKGNIIKELGGFPFHTLTEDYEISMYSTINDLTTYYNEKSIYYDEQPVKYKDTIMQRVRWIKGYFSVRRKYLSLLRKTINLKSKNLSSKLDFYFGVIPYIFIILAVLLLLINFVIKSSYNLVYIKFIIILLIFIYVILMLLSTLLVLKEGNKINLTKKMKFKVVFYNPIFMLTFIYCGIKALLIKDVKWGRTKHGMSNKKD